MGVRRHIHCATRNAPRQNALPACLTISHTLTSSPWRPLPGPPLSVNPLRAWSQPLAAVVYIPLLHGRVAAPADAALEGRGLDNAMMSLFRLFHRLEASADSCVLDLEIVTERLCTQEAAAAPPAGALWNRALLLARTKVCVTGA